MAASGGRPSRGIPVQARCGTPPRTAGSDCGGRRWTAAPATVMLGGPPHPAAPSARRRPRGRRAARAMRRGTVGAPGRGPALRRGIGAVSPARCPMRGTAAPVTHRRRAGANDAVPRLAARWGIGVAPPLAGRPSRDTTAARCGGTAPWTADSATAGPPWTAPVAVTAGGPRQETGVATLAGRPSRGTAGPATRRRPSARAGIRQGPPRETIVVAAPPHLGQLPLRGIPRGFLALETPPWTADSACGGPPWTAVSAGATEE